MLDGEGGRYVIKRIDIKQTLNDAYGERGGKRSYDPSVIKKAILESRETLRSEDVLELSKTLLQLLKDSLACYPGEDLEQARTDVENIKECFLALDAQSQFDELLSRRLRGAIVSGGPRFLALLFYKANIPNAEAAEWYAKYFDYAFKSDDMNVGEITHCVYTCGMGVPAILEAHREQIDTRIEELIAASHFSDALQLCWAFDLPTSHIQEKLRGQIMEAADSLIGTPLEKMRDPEYLPSVSEIEQFDFRSDKLSGKFLWNRLTDQPGYAKYEIFTREYVALLAQHLAGVAEHAGKTNEDPLEVIEVGAGNGRLAHFVTEILKANGVKSVRYTACEPGVWDNRRDFDDSPGTYYKTIPLYTGEAITRFKPDLILTSWMPPATDWTPDFRKANVKEYILIGIPHDEITGSPESWDDAVSDERSTNGDGEYKGQELLGAAAVQVNRNQSSGPWLRSNTYVFSNEANS